MTKESPKQDFVQGIRHGSPIALGYLAVSFSLGVMVKAGGLSVLQGAVMSLTNVTSAGEFAGLRIIIAGGTIAELILTQIIINLRYALMSLSLSQKLDEAVTFRQRLLIAFANTDEIFAVAISRAKSVTFPYMAGLELLPIIGWTAGTVLGAAAGGIMPGSITSAMSVMLYGMFIAIVFPKARKIRSVMITALIAIALSCMFFYLPFFKGVSDGVSIILSTVIAAVAGAVLFPVQDREEEI